MKKNTFYNVFQLLAIAFILMLSVSCAKDSEPTGSGEIKFVSLVVEKEVLAITELTKVSATAEGSNLTYTWKCDNELGIFEGSGSEVLFTICHEGKFKITCEVTDNQNHMVSKDAYVTYTE